MSFRDEMSGMLDRLGLGLPGTAEGRMEALVLLSSVFIGADEPEIARGLEFEPEWVESVGKRLRANGIWSEAVNRHAKDYDTDEGGTAFLLDTMVALGRMFCAHEDGEPKYGLTSEGKKQAASLIEAGRL